MNMGAADSRLAKAAVIHHLQPRPGLLQRLLRAVLRGTLRLLFKRLVRPPVSLAWQRRIVAGLAQSNRPASSVRFVAEHGNGVPLEIVRAGPAPTASVVLYLHGGAYCLGSPRTHRSLTSRLALQGCADVVVPDYRLAPEHPYPAALDDALATYRWLLSRGYDPASIILAGDSAGGGLALALALRLRELALPQPARLLLLSPWVDLTFGGDSIRQLRDRDPMLAIDWIRHGAELYRGRRPASDPGCSPLLANLAGLPPMLIQVGSDEVLLDDARRLAQRVGSVGGAVELEIYDGMWHVFQLHAGLLATADAALVALAASVRG